MFRVDPADSFLATVIICSRIQTKRSRKVARKSCHKLLRPSSKKQVAELTGESATKGFAKNKHQKTLKGVQRQELQHTKAHLFVQEEIISI